MQAVSGDVMTSAGVQEALCPNHPSDSGRSLWQIARAFPIASKNDDASRVAAEWQLLTAPLSDLRLAKTLKAYFFTCSTPPPERHPA